MSELNVHLSPGLPIDGISPEQPGGRVGILIFDQNQMEYVLVTAVQITGAASEILVNEVPVARSSLDRYPDDMKQGANEAVELLRFAPLLAQGMVDPKQPHLASAPDEPSVLVDPSSILGDEVLVHVSETLKIPAQLVSASAQFRLRLPNSDTSLLFTNAIELKSADGKPVTIKGETGSLVTTLDGHPVGLIVSGTNNRSFAAPLADGVKRRMKKWIVQSAPDINNYNANKLDRIRREENNTCDDEEVVTQSEDEENLILALLRSDDREEQKAKGDLIGDRFFGRASLEDEEDE